MFLMKIGVESATIPSNGTSIRGPTGVGAIHVGETRGCLAVDDPTKGPLAQMV